MASKDIQITIMGQCIYCTRYKELERGKLRCDAFPNGIPEAIVSGKWDHRLHFADDPSELLFDLIPGKEQEFESWTSIRQMKMEILAKLEASPPNTKTKPRPAIRPELRNRD